MFNCLCGALWGLGYAGIRVEFFLEFRLQGEVFKAFALLRVRVLGVAGSMIRTYRDRVLFWDPT